jgi:hypothetical protein
MSNAGAASPEVFEERFYNPYTFLEFPSDPSKPPEKPTPLTIDEIEPDRFTGILELRIKTLSPLLTCHPEGRGQEGQHQTYKALAIGNDVIVPASGVRGALRFLLTVVTGGPLSHVDDEVWLCQGRDLQESQQHPWQLAMVEEPGDREHSGVVKLGTTDLISDQAIEKLLAQQKLNGVGARRPGEKPQRALWINEGRTMIFEKQTPDCTWQIKLSGPPVGRAINGKNEGVFKSNGNTIELREELWMAYAGRNRHGSHPVLNEGDLVWLEPCPGVKEITKADHVASIQWARWGRKGERLLEIVERYHKSHLPSSRNPKGLVDEVTNLFGQVPDATLKDRAAGPFAARVRPENLVFYDAARNIQEEITLAPLQAPRPGCVAFYRKWDGSPRELDELSNKDQPLRGYKVYRTSLETSGGSSPWIYPTQGVYKNGELQDLRRKINKTCDLLESEQTGRLRIACRGLSRRELALLLAMCTVDWRLGGGKPLGLGHCRVISARILGEDGLLCTELSPQNDGLLGLPDNLRNELSAQDHARLKAWQASQAPVAPVRYPRAVEENRESVVRGGHVWFNRHASVQKGRSGLETMWTEGELKDNAGNDQIRAQALPPFDPDNPLANVLFGYDLYTEDSPQYQLKGDNGKRTFHKKLDPYRTVESTQKQDRGRGKSQGSKTQRRKRR